MEPDLKPRPLDSNPDPRPQAAAERRRRAEEFVNRELSDENMPRLLNQLLTPPPERPSLIKKICHGLSRLLRL
jgi:hypothetical protein